MKRFVKYILVFLVLIAIAIVIAYIIRPASFLEIHRGEDEISIWIKIKHFSIEKEISGTDTYKYYDVQWSPNKRLLAYYDNTREIIVDKEWELKVFDPRTFQTKVIFIGNWYTSFFKWIDNDTIRVYQRAGTGVRIYRDIAINIPEPFVASEHETPEYWVMEKTF